MNTQILKGIVPAVLAGGLWGSAAVAQAPATSVSSGVYTADQAKRGQTVYVEKCAQCHLEDLTGGTSPPLAGSDFLNSVKGKTVGAVFEQVQMTMPFDSPGSLTAEQYAEVLAYVLSVNKFPSGDKELAHQIDALQQIVFDAQP
jgi:mono/diheme cytochrome c family protein